ncbi:hypothetical protein BKA82DRAFT_4467081 [Pisolithus tinctorius]|nr:hypothetical protein BKA82DRAFT_4467081 [Pisolithus tinctorius]
MWMMLLRHQLKGYPPRLCNTTDQPEVFDGEGRKVDATGVEGSLGHGHHNIEYEMVFKSNPHLFFMTPVVFESGSEAQFKKMREFVMDCAKTPSWRRGYMLSGESFITDPGFCIPLNECHRMVLAAERKFFNECDTGHVPVIVLLTKADTLELDAIQEIEELQLEIGMQQEGADFTSLLKCTANALNEESQQKLLISTQQSGLALCIEFAVMKTLKGCMEQRLGHWEPAKLAAALATWFPYHQVGRFMKLGKQKGYYGDVQVSGVIAGICEWSDGDKGCMLTLVDRDWLMGWIDNDVFTHLCGHALIGRFGEWSHGRRRWMLMVFTPTLVDMDSQRDDVSGIMLRVGEVIAGDSEYMLMIFAPAFMDMGLQYQPRVGQGDFVSMIYTQDVGSHTMEFTFILILLHATISIWQLPMTFPAGSILVFEYFYFLLQVNQENQAGVKKCMSLAVKEYQMSGVQATVIDLIASALQTHDVKEAVKVGVNCKGHVYQVLDRGHVFQGGLRTEIRAASSNVFVLRKAWPVLDKYGFAALWTNPVTKRKETRTGHVRGQILTGLG